MNHTGFHFIYMNLQHCFIHISKGNDDENYRFIKDGKIKNTSTLAIILLISIILKKGMNILGVSLPSKM